MGVVGIICSMGSLTDTGERSGSKTFATAIPALWVA